MDKCIPMRLRMPWFPGRGLTLLMLAVLVILAVPYVASPAPFTVNRTTDFEGCHSWRWGLRDRPWEWLVHPASCHPGEQCLT